MGLRPFFVLAWAIVATASGLPSPAPAAPIRFKSDLHVPGSDGGVHPRVAADFDGDTRPDLAGHFVRSSAIAIWRNSGTGALAAPIAIPAGEHPLDALAAADLDGDGRGDLVAASAESPDGAALVLRSTGAGFTTPVRFPVGASGTVAVALGDLDGDGDPDLALGNRSLGAVVLFFNDGAGGFGGRRDLASGGIPVPWLQDLDADGDLDLVITKGAQLSLSVLRNDGGVLTPLADPGITGIDAVEDLDGDARADLRTTSGGPIYEGIGDGTFANRGVAPPARATADLDRDGRKDLFAFDALSGPGSNACLAIFQQQRFAFGSESDLHPASDVHHAVAADLDGDGWQDLIYKDHTASRGSPLVVRRNLGGRLDGVRILTTQFHDPLRLATGDVDGDGDADVLSGVISYGAPIFLNQGDGRFGRGQSAGLNSYIRDVAITDVNGDGEADLLGQWFDGGQTGLYVRLNQGGGSFANAVRYPCGLAYHMATGDFDSDGDVDVLHSTGDLMENDGAGRFTRRPFAGDLGNSAGPGTFHQQSTGDVDGDGRPDVAVVRGDSLIVWRNTGDGLSPFHAARLDGPAHRVALVRLHGRGALHDLVVVLENGGLRTFLNFGGRFHAPIPGTVARSGWALSGMVLGDLDRDGRPDLVAGHHRGASHTSEASVAVLRNLGRGRFGDHSDYPVGGGIGGIAIADLDGDGWNDLLVSEGNQVEGAAIFHLTNVTGVAEVAARPAAEAVPAAAAIAPAAGFGIRSVWPNPARTGAVRVRFAVEQAGEVEVEWLDVAGRRVSGLRRAAVAGEHELELATPRVPAPGLYLIRVRHGGRVAEAKAVVMR